MGTGGTGAFASGPITGFGSIIVDGVHFDESVARIEDDDGSARGRSDLHLGTMVEVESGEIRDGAATASQVRVVSALIGSVESVAANALVVNGVTVRVDAGTVFDDRFIGGIAAITVGRVVEVYGYVSSTPAEIEATRIEPKDGATTFKFRGMVAALNTQARTFDIGNQHFVYANSVSGVGELRNGAFVRVVVGLQPDAQGRWVVSSIGNTGPGGGDLTQVKARGVINWLRVERQLRGRRLHGRRQRGADRRRPAGGRLAGRGRGPFAGRRADRHPREGRGQQPAGRARGARRDRHPRCCSPRCSRSAAAATA